MLMKAVNPWRDIINFGKNINILVGKNGQGKSSLLRSLCDYCNSRSIPTIAIANSIFDKYQQNQKGVYTLRASSGIKVVEESFKSAFSELLRSDNLSHINIISNTFRYIGYNSRVGVKIDANSLNININSIKEKHNLDIDFQRIMAGLTYYKNYIAHRNADVLWVNFSYESGYATGFDSFIYFLINIQNLIKLNIKIKYKFYLHSFKNEIIPLYEASSGELQQLTIMSFISSNIERDTVIIIDEPENSLHPRWQREYVKMLFDNFEYFRPKVVLATHSPLIAESAQLSEMAFSVYLVEDQTLNLINSNNNDISIESVLWKYFDYIPPQSSHLSKILVKTANDFNENKINHDELKSIVINIKSAVSDKRQINLIDKLIEVVAGENQ